MMVKDGRMQTPSLVKNVTHEPPRSGNNRVTAPGVGMDGNGFGFVLQKQTGHNIATRRVLLSFQFNSTPLARSGRPIGVRLAFDYCNWSRGVLPGLVYTLRHVITCSEDECMCNILY